MQGNRKGIACMQLSELEFDIPSPLYSGTNYAMHVITCDSAQHL